MPSKTARCRYMATYFLWEPVLRREKPRFPSAMVSPLSLPLCPSSPALTRWHQSLRVGGGENEALELKNLQLVAKLLQVFELLTLLSETL